jgi:hypothetical protein
VKRAALRAGEALVLPTIGLVAALVVAPGRAELWGHLYLVCLLGIALVTTVGLLRADEPEPAPSAFDAALRRREREAVRLPELARLEREVTLAAASAFDLHYRLRPILREVAGGLLFARRGIDLDQQPDRARAVLGDEAWRLVEPGRPPPGDRHGPGVPPEELARVIERLEAI